MNYFRTFFAAAMVAAIAGTPMFGQQIGYPTRNLSDTNEVDNTTNPQPDLRWWSEPVASQMFAHSQPVTTDLANLFSLALTNSQQIKIYSETPLARETAIAEAAAALDWTRYFDGIWDDLNEPVGSSLTVGGTGTRFLDRNLRLTGGLRRRTLSGLEVDVSQRIGHQDTNSTFFIPEDQGTAQLSLSVNIPLLRGRGRVYNSSLLYLARIDVATAKEDFKRQLQSHLLEVARAYWSLYLERSSFTQRFRLTQSTEDILNRLRNRQALDASPVQLTMVQAALTDRQSELIRATAAIRNAETRLRALVNAAELGSDEATELIPLQPPSSPTYQADVKSQMELAMQNRPEIRAATQEVKAASIRLNMSKHEVLPILNLITRTYVSGLQGDSDIGQAWVDQFSVGAPSYSVGIQYELPIGNRAAYARVTRRNIEKRQLESQFRLAIENVKADVEIAVRELSTALREVEAKQVSVAAASSEVAALSNRWHELVGQEGSASLTLESLLRSQERLAAAEFALSEAELTYNLALMNLNLANGSLLETEQVSFGRASRNGTPETILDINGR